MCVRYDCVSFKNFCESLISFIPWEEWEFVLEKGSTQERRNELMPSRQWRTLWLLPFPGMALALPCSGLPPLWVLWTQGKNLIPDLKITPAPWAVILWDPSTRRASYQSQDCQQICAGKDLTSRVSLSISAWAPRAGQPWEQASRVAEAV